MNDYRLLMLLFLLYMLLNVQCYSQLHEKEGEFICQKVVNVDYSKCFLGRKF